MFRVNVGRFSQYTIGLRVRGNASKQLYFCREEIVKLADYQGLGFTCVNSLIAFNEITQLNTVKQVHKDQCLKMFFFKVLTLSLPNNGFFHVINF